jgi:hypothetical protein
MEGWRQERLGARAGTHREKEKYKTSLQERKKRKTYLTLTGLLMEGLGPTAYGRQICNSPQHREISNYDVRTRRGIAPQR